MSSKFEKEFSIFYEEYIMMDNISFKENNLEKILVCFNEEIQKIQQELIELNRWRMAPNAKCLTREEVASWLECKPETLKDYEKKGLLLPIYPNAKKKYCKQDVERFMRGYMPKKARVRK